MSLTEQWDTCEEGLGQLGDWGKDMGKDVRQE